MRDPKVLVFDIETSAILASVWGLRDQNISLNQIVKDWYVLAWAAKWLNDPASKVMYCDQSRTKNVENDKEILKKIWQLLDEADIVITQNGKRFDSRKLNARFILLGMKPPSPYEHLDTYQILSRVADFTSDKLEYYTDKICTKYKKLHHKKFPGMELWNQCIAGNKKAWAEMKKYNVHDVLATEELYLKTRGWVPKTSPTVYILTPDSRKCGVCGVTAVERNGYYTNKAGRHIRLHCTACGVWRLGEKVKVKR